MSPSPSSRPRLAGVDNPTPADFRLAAVDCYQKAADARLRGEFRVADTWTREAQVCELAAYALELREWRQPQAIALAWCAVAFLVFMVLGHLVAVAW